MSFRIRNVTEINETPRPVQVKLEPEDPPWQALPDTELDETQPPEQGTIPSTSSFSNPTITSSVKIKEEPKDKDPPLSSLPVRRVEDTQLDDTQAHHADTVPSTSTFANPTITSSVKIKDEPKDDPPKTSLDSVGDTKPAPPAPGRPCCRFGIKCYRQNASHRDMEAHPGDPDYKLPDYPKPPSGTPQCPYGATCYRRNPVHFQQMSHSGSPPPPTRPKNGGGAKPPPAKKRRRQFTDSEDEEDSEDDDEMADFLNDDSDEDLDPYGGSDEDDIYDPDGDPDSSY